MRIKRSRKRFENAEGNRKKKNRIIAYLAPRKRPTAPDVQGISSTPISELIPPPVQAKPSSLMTMTTRTVGLCSEVAPSIRICVVEGGVARVR